jgi:asparagine synthase (glutamine-hydrolysing)
MCGISGFYQIKNKLNEHDLRAMTGILSHRGPDAQGFYIGEKVMLGHRRLSIIDLSEQANQPMFSHSGKSVIVFNGEIYNYREVTTQLGIKQKTTSDTEMIVEAFEILGPDFVNRLNGMFAMAIYRIDEQKLYLFRDRIGIKPLYYYHYDGVLAFTSELKAFEQLPSFQNEKKINPPAIRQFLHLGYIPAPMTIYKNVYKFPQGNYGVFDGNELQIKPYWVINDKIKPEIISDENEALLQLKELVESSVKYRLISDVPYGTFLSGGIDSSLVSAVAQKVSNNRLKTFSIGFESTKYNEAPFAQKVAEHLGTDHHTFTMKEQDAMDKVPVMFFYYDEPFADSSALPTMLVSEMARKHVTMTLSGDGGDELFHGYGMYQWATRLNNPLIKILRNPLYLGLSQMGNRYQRIGQMFNWQDGDDLTAHIFSQEQYFFSTRELELICKDANQTIIFEDTSAGLSRSLSPASKQALIDLKYYLPDDLLVKVDRASMRYSLETRVPLLDYRLVEFALNLDDSLKIKGKTSKYLLKELLYQYVPRELFDRPKWGFSVPLGRWLKTDLSYLSIEYLKPEKVKNAGLVNPEEVEKLLKRFYEKNQDYLYNRVWALICLHQWYYNRFETR